MSAPRSLSEAVSTGSYWPALDGLRGASILLVVTWHVHGAYTFRPLGGELGVFVFFVLSGFLISLLLTREWEASGRLALRTFYARRAFRILPLYLLMLGVYSALVLGAHAVGREAAYRAALPYYLTLFQEILRYRGDPFAPFQFTWSLGVEEKFYLLWPAAAFLAVRRRDARYLATIAGIALGALLSARGVQPAAGVAAAYAFVLVGCLLAQLVSDPAFEGRLDVLASPWVGAAALVALAPDPLALNGFLAAIAAFALIPALVAQRGPIAAVLSTPVMTWLGRISYSIYFVNQLALHAARRLFTPPASVAGDVALLVAGLVLTVPAAALLHWWVERPMQRLGRRLSARWIPVHDGGTPVAPPLARGDISGSAHTRTRSSPDP